MCDRWLNWFENFYADMGPMPTPKHTIERIDNNGNYEPGNCKWATRLEQNQNTRQALKITVNGVTKCKRAWERILGLYLHHYLRTWPMEEVTDMIAQRLAGGMRTRRRRRTEHFSTDTIP